MPHSLRSFDWNRPEFTFSIFSKLYRLTLFLLNPHINMKPWWHPGFFIPLQKKKKKAAKWCKGPETVTGAVKWNLLSVIGAERHLNSSWRWWSSGFVIYRRPWLSRSASRKCLSMNHHKGTWVFNIKCRAALRAARKRPLLNITAQISHMIEVCFMEARPETL